MATAGKHRQDTGADVTGMLTWTDSDRQMWIAPLGTPIPAAGSVPADDWLPVRRVGIGTVETVPDRRSTFNVLVESLRRGDDPARTAALAVGHVGLNTRSDLGEGLRAAVVARLEAHEPLGEIAADLTAQTTRATT
jgi:hypothetical protein